jgi:thiamine-monophosphate kinase
MVAGKLLRVNLSDLAAMGADPLGYLTVIARPPEIDAAYLEGLAAGFAHDQRAFGLHLLGGDTVSTTGPLVLTLTILGSVPRDAALLRRGARADDLVMVSGTLGEAALGLRVLRGLAVPEDDAVQLVERYRSPQPRLGLGRGLRGVASAAIDISDGLVADLGHILAASGVGAIIEAARIPLSDCAAGLPGALDAALGGGDDYELLVTVPPARRSAAETAAAAAGVRLTTIGRITAAPGLVVQGRDGQAIEPATRGWRHF